MTTLIYDIREVYNIFIYRDEIFKRLINRESNNNFSYIL